ncbi:MAG: Maf-like protein [Bauldia sp.]
MPGPHKLVLASGSPRRLQLLNQVGIEPDALVPTQIDETPRSTELPRNLSVRLARAKAEAALASWQRTPDAGAGYILAADTVVAVGRRILPKAELLSDAEKCLSLLSGRAHRVYTGVCLITPAGAYRQRLVETRVRFKRLSRDDRQNYLASGEWRGKAGGYGIQGIAGAFVVRLVGSYTAVVGLPLYETVALLAGEGYPVHFNWIRHG